MNLRNYSELRNEKDINIEILVYVYEMPKIVTNHLSGKDWYV